MTSHIRTLIFCNGNREYLIVTTVTRLCSRTSPGLSSFFPTSWRKFDRLSAVFPLIARPIQMLKLILILALLTSNVVQAQTIRNGEDLLRAMHDRYKDSWYHTVTFTQKSTTYKPDGTSIAETWYEAALLPGKLRIDIGPATVGQVYVFS